MNRRALLGQAGEGRRIELVGYLTTATRGVSSNKGSKACKESLLRWPEIDNLAQNSQHTRANRPFFELPLQVTSSQAKRLRVHLGAARQVYNAVLSEGHQRFRHLRADPAWQAARAIPRSQKLGRQRAFAALRAQYGISLVRAARGGQRLELRAGPAITWMRCWPSGFPRAPIAPSTGCASVRRAACA